MNILESLRTPNSAHPAFVSNQTSINYEKLHQYVNDFTDVLNNLAPNCIAVYLDNCLQWIIADLATHACEIPIVPLPTFFSQSQLTHILEDVGADLIITHHQLNKQPILSLFQKQPIQQDNNGLEIYQRNTSREVSYPNGLAKITYTSGSTGTPKGVCLNARAQLNVVNSLSTILQPLKIKKHLCVLPLSTLLENIAGVWAPLSIGATIALPSLVELGFGSTSNLDSKKFLTTISKYDPESIILVPELLNMLVSAYESGFPKLSNIKFIAVGGAKVSHSLLERAQQLDLPVYEGYGLSEACSVTTLNRPGHNKIRTSGQALPHVKLRISDEGEIEVSGSNMLGYLNDIETIQKYYPTGDLGEIDEDGYLIIHGRKKNMFITSFGRQVNPEWVEETLLEHEQISQAVVYGESLPFNIAVIVPSNNEFDIQDIDELIKHSNKVLPEYAKISQYVIADTPFNPQEDTLTTNGRVKRIKIYNRYSKQIQQLIETNVTNSCNEVSVAI